jgi:hypothetical protein
MKFWQPRKDTTVTSEVVICRTLLTEFLEIDKQYLILESCKSNKEVVFTDSRTGEKYSMPRPKYVGWMESYTETGYTIDNIEDYFLQLKLEKLTKDFLEDINEI